jgi:MFS family permease
MRYAVLSFLCMATVIAYVQRSALGVPAKQIEHELGLGPQDMGLVMGAWYWLYALCQLPAGWLVDRLGSKVGLIAFAILWSALTGIVGLATGFPLLVVLWGAMGAAQSGMFPCATKSIGALFPPAGRAFASGSLGCCMAIGWMISPAVTAELLRSNTWQVVFLLYAMPGFVWAFAYALMPSFPEPKPSANDQPVDWAHLVTDGPMIFLCLQQFFRAAAAAFFFTWFIRYLTETRGVNELEAGKLAIWPGVGGMLGGLVGGATSDFLLSVTKNPRLSRQGLAAAAMAAAASFSLVAYFAESVTLLAFALSAGAFFCYFAGVSGYAVAITYGGKRVATVFATMNMCGNIGAGLFPFLVGWIVKETGDWNNALLLVIAFFAADVAAWLLVNPKGTLFEESP